MNSAVQCKAHVWTGCIFRREWPWLSSFITKRNCNGPSARRGSARRPKLSNHEKIVAFDNQIEFVMNMLIKFQATPKIHPHL